MNVTATQAKNHFGQVLEEAQVRPVVIEKSGRRHSVLLSARHYDALVAAAQAAPAVAVSSAADEPHSPEAERFYAQYKDWVDMQNDLVEQYGVFGEEYRLW